MVQKIRLFIIIAGCCLVLTGCKEKNTETSSDVDAEQVKQKTAEAVDTAGAYLNQQKEVLLEKAGQAFSQLKTDTQELITNLKGSGQQSLQNLAKDLDGKLQTAQKDFNNLKESENFQKAKDTFDAAVTELKLAYEKAKAALQNETAE